MEGEKSVQDSRIGAGALCALWNVRHPGAWSEKLNLEHGRTATAKNQGARQEPSHPGTYLGFTEQDVREFRQMQSKLLLGRVIS